MVSHSGSPKTIAAEVSESASSPFQPATTLSSRAGAGRSARTSRSSPRIRLSRSGSGSPCRRSVELWSGIVPLGVRWKTAWANSASRRLNTASTWWGVHR
ncbi:hypothetical protein MAJHIDBO_01321 [Propionibacterium freudenreichii subsp. shermanii]|nr:hypothetical protein MAJHIDBO_01321 [Propionibacterium freudenreichii subsp. shermanii]SPS09116.1 hypothetical protein MAJHIDBO_01321 [Propionibacterium freudenreichii subsp. shermanii]